MFFLTVTDAEKCFNFYSLDFLQFFSESLSTPRKETPKSKVRFSILKCKETFVRLEGIFFKLDESVKCLCVGPTGRTSFNVNVKAEVGHRVEGE